MSERAFMKVRVHIVNGELWVDASCTQAHVPCAINGPLADVGAWLEEHLRRFHEPHRLTATLNRGAIDA